MGKKSDRPNLVTNVRRRENWGGKIVRQVRARKKCAVKDRSDCLRQPMHEHARKRGRNRAPRAIKVEDFSKDNETKEINAWSQTCANTGNDVHSRHQKNKA